MCERGEDSAGLRDPVSKRIERVRIGDRSTRVKSNDVSVRYCESEAAELNKISGSLDLTARRARRYCSTQAADAPSILP